MIWCMYDYVKVVGYVCYVFFLLEVIILEVSVFFLVDEIWGYNVYIWLEIWIKFGLRMFDDCGYFLRL